MKDPAGGNREARGLSHTSPEREPGESDGRSPGLRPGASMEVSWSGTAPVWSEGS
jgi:hypothetical protein